MSFHVHIKIADQGWILEKSASEIAKRAAYVTYGTSPDAKADIQYYCNYSAKNSERISPIEIAFFTHIEQEENARRRFFDVARQVDHCVCMSKRYANALKEAGITHVSVIPCGVDLRQFHPKVRIGVIGRTYHTGRKGEALVQAVYDTPGIEWRFTGKGWPGPCAQVPDDGMCDFYNDLDYVLVPSLYEGGPMCILEGLACGVPVISSDVGWAPDFPHIPFRNGDADSLRSVLTELVAERNKLRASVEHVTWENWAENHVRLFESLAERKTVSLPRPVAENDIHAALVLHGQENIALGGPSVRAPGTLLHLRERGIDARFSYEADAAEGANIAHVFNLWPPYSCLAALHSAKASGLKTVLSPIFLNLQHNRFSTTEYLGFFKQKKGRSLDSALKATAKRIREEPNLPLREPFAGYHAQVRACIAEADHVILLSEYEKRCLAHIRAVPRASSLVRNPVDPNRFANADPELFRRRYGLDKYILCVGRLEARKNQIILAYAAHRLSVPVVFIGHSADPHYYELLRAVADDRALFVPRLAPEDPLLASAFTGADAFCLPSWSEGAPLAALEAAACGIPLVLSDRSSEPEYFDELAHYVNPADVEGLCEALENAVAGKNDERRARELRALVERRFSWTTYTRGTVEAYLSTLGESVPPAGTFSAEAGSPSSAADAPIYMDMTHSFHVGGTPTGMRRVEYCAYRALLKLYPERLRPIVWLNGYFSLADNTAPLEPSLKKLESMMAKGKAVRINGAELDPRGHILVLGGAWTSNPRFTAHLRELKIAAKLPLTILIHDLLPLTIPHTFSESVVLNFTTSLAMLNNCADQFLVYSEATRRNVQKYLLKTGQAFKKISTFPMGYQKPERPEHCDAPQILSECEQLKEHSFVLMVSSIVVRKNHALLLDVWRKLIEKRGADVPRLVFIGAPQWGAEHLLETIQSDPVLKNFVFHLQGVDDDNLLWFYEHCLFTVYPSKAEGWGLPVVESLAQGKHCITSACSSMQEIAPEFTDRLDPADVPAWVDRIEYWLDHPGALAEQEQIIRAHYAPVSWDESVRHITGALDGLRLREWNVPGLLPGASLDFCRCASPDWKFLPDWTLDEEYGYGAPLPSPPLRFRYQGAGRSFWLALVFRPSIPLNGDILLHINGYEACRCPAGTAYVEQVIHVDAGMGYLENSRLITLEFSTPGGGGSVHLVSLVCAEDQDSLQALRNEQEMPVLGNWQQAQNDAQKYMALRLRYYRYKILSKILPGKRRRTYKEKRKNLKQRLRAARKILQTSKKG